MLEREGERSRGSMPQSLSWGKRIAWRRLSRGLDRLLSRGLVRGAWYRCFISADSAKEEIKRLLWFLNNELKIASRLGDTYPRHLWANHLPLEERFRTKRTGKVNLWQTNATKTSSNPLPSYYLMQKNRLR